MNDFRQAKRGRPLSTIDGIISSQPQSSASRAQGSIGGFRPRAQAGTRASGLIGDFRASEGFHPAAQPAIAPLSSKLAVGRNPQASFLPVPDLSDTSSPRRKHKRHVSWGKVIKRAALVIPLTLIITGGYLFGKGYLKAHSIFKGGTAQAAALQENVNPQLLNGEGDGRVNVLLLGIGGEGHDGPDLTDTILVASIDPVNHKAALLSVPRDLWVKLPPNNFIGTYQKINAAYEAGKYSYLGKEDPTNNNTKAVAAGFASVDKAVEQVLGIPIHYHVLVDFHAFSQGIDAVGGVSVNVPEQLYDPTIAWENNNNPVIAKAGLQTFNGKQALLYTRSRETSSDFARTERQRAVLLALKQKVLTLGTFSNPDKVSNLLDALGNNVVTDLSITDAMRLYDIGKNIGDGGVQSVGLADPPNHFVTTGNMNGISIVQPTAGLFDYTAIQSFVRNTLKDGFLASENPTVLVLNGTNTPGLASTKTDELKSFGYNTLPPTSAPSANYPKTVVVDLTNGVKKYTRRYLEQRYGTTVVTSLPDPKIVPGTADFVIILGQNATAAAP